MIRKIKHPYIDKNIAVSLFLENNKNESLCMNCIHRKNGFKDCEIANILYELAKTTGVSTLVKWCPIDKFEYYMPEKD